MTHFHRISGVLHVEDVALPVLAEQAGTTLMLITHEPRLGAKCAREIRIGDGRVVDSPPDAPLDGSC